MEVLSILGLAALYCLIIFWAAIGFGLTVEAVVEGEADWLDYLVCWLWPFLVIVYLTSDLFAYALNAFEKQWR